MSVMNKPDYKIFAQDAKSGEYVAFPDILRGWGITLDQYNGFPPMELFNSAAKRIDEWLMYLTQRGLPEWDAAVDYPKDAMTQHAGVYYVSLKVTKGEQPNNSQASWKKLTEFLGVDKKLDKDSVLQTTGTSTTNVMSQKAVTDLANTKADGKIFYYSGGERGIHGSNGESFIVGNASGHTGVYKDGWSWMFNASGVMIYGDVPVARISDLNTKLFGAGQSVQNVTAQRSVGTTYKNNTGKAICVSAGGTAKTTTDPVFLSLEVDGYLMATSKTATGGGANGMPHVSVCGTVLPGSYYIVKDGTAGNDKVDLKFWTEVR